MVSIDEIVKRYNDSVADYASYIVASNESNEDAMEKHLRDAGEGLGEIGAFPPSLGRRNPPIRS